MDNVSKLQTLLLPIMQSFLSATGQDYMLYLILSIVSGIVITTTLSKLLSTPFFNNTVLEPGVRQVYGLARKFYDKASQVLTAVHAQRQYSNTFNYQRNQCRSRIIHKRTRTTVPYRKIYRGRNRCLLLALLSTITVTHATSVTEAMTATGGRGPRYKPIPAHFDTDSFVVGLDSHASACMSYDKSHFESIGPYRSSEKVRGIGSAPIKGIGTMVLELVSDDGQPHVVRVHNTLLVPALPKVLISPQHFAENCEGTCRKETALLMKERWA